MKLVIGFLTGAMLGVFGAFTQADRFYIGTVLVPYGPLLTIAFILAVEIWLIRRLQSRLAGLGLVVGWVLATIGLGFDSPTGDVALAGNLIVTGYLVGGSVIFSMLAMLRPRRQLSN
jgi:prepilin signal peptidase PulO-like enzyme (type II secretory pathway)